MTPSSKLPKPSLNLKDHTIRPYPETIPHTTTDLNIDQKPGKRKKGKEISEEILKIKKRNMKGKNDALRGKGEARISLLNHTTAREVRNQPM